MLTRFLDYVRSCFLIWIPPFYRVYRKMPLMWLLYLLLLFEMRGNGPISYLVTRFQYPEYLPENRTSAPPLELTKDVLHSVRQAESVVILIFLIALSVFIVYHLRKRYADPDSLGRTLCIKEAERKRSAYVGGLSAYLLLAVLFLMYYCAFQLSFSIPAFAGGLCACILVYSLAFLLMFSGFSGGKEERS